MNVLPANQSPAPKLKQHPPFAHSRRLQLRVFLSKGRRAMSRPEQAVYLGVTAGHCGAHLLLLASLAATSCDNTVETSYTHSFSLASLARSTAPLLAAALPQASRACLSIKWKVACHISTRRSLVIFLNKTTKQSTVNKRYAGLFAILRPGEPLELRRVVASALLKRIWPKLKGRV